MGVAEAQEDRKRDYTDGSERAEAGTPDHSKGGDRSAPSQVNVLGIVPPSANAELQSWIVSRLGSSAGSASVRQQPGVESSQIRPAIATSDTARAEPGLECMRDPSIGCERIVGPTIATNLRLPDSAGSKNGVSSFFRSEK